MVGCTFRNLGNHAIAIYEGKENGVVGCDMCGMGGGGVYLVGGAVQDAHAGRTLRRE